MTLEPHHFLHLKCDRLTSSEEAAKPPSRRMRRSTALMLRDAAP
jgi:hypothetical protein